MSELTGQTREQVQEMANEMGVAVFFREDDELFIDLDDGAVLNEKVHQVLTKNGIEIISMLRTTSKSGNGDHVYLHVGRSLNNAESAALQAALGSDPTREALTILTRDFSALFETKAAAKHVQRWRDSKIQDYAYQG